MNIADKRACAMGFAWIVAVAFVTQHEAGEWFRHAQINDMVAESELSQENGGFTPEQWRQVEKLLDLSEPTAEIANSPDEGTTSVGGGAGAHPAPPFEIRIAGPVDSLVGDLVELSVETTTEATSFAWSIDPPARGLLQLDGGSKAVFSNRNAGDYLVIVSAANANGSTAHATLPFTLRPAPPENPLTIESLADAMPAPDVADLIRRWSAEVITDNRAGEASAVAGSFRSIANLLASGQLAATPDVDALYEVERAAEQNLGPAGFARWESFFRRVRDFLYPLAVKNHLVTPDQYANTFNNLAAELEKIAAGQ